MKVRQLDARQLNLKKLSQLVYLRQIALQCRFALNAFEALEIEVQPPESLEEGQRPWMSWGMVQGRGQLNSDEAVFFHLQALLTATANVSKFLWPTGQAKLGKDRGAALRQCLGLPEDVNASVIGNRDIRNGFDHFDERLDDVYQQDIDPNLDDEQLNQVFSRLILADLKVVNTSDPARWDTVAKRHMRVYNATDRVAIFGGTTLALGPLVDELERLASLATKLTSIPLKFF